MFTIKVAALRDDFESFKSTSDFKRRTAQWMSFLMIIAFLFAVESTILLIKATPRLSKARIDS